MTETLLDANVVIAFHKTGAAGRRHLPPPRRITHVCRECGEHAVLAPPVPPPRRWTCPWCGASNPLGRPR